MAEQLEKVIDDLKQLDPGELAMVRGFALGLKARRDMDAANDQAE